MNQERSYETLDAVVVIGCLLIVAGMILGFFLMPVKESITPVLSSLATAILALPGMYGAYRWGNAVGKRTGHDPQGATLTATASVSTDPETT